MHTRDVGRWMSMVALVGATILTAMSCGGSGSTAVGNNVDASLDDSGGGTFQPGSDGGVASNCTPTTCAQAGFTCGPNADGCGGIIQCGTCPTGEYCGGGGFSVCGNPSATADGGSPCTPKTCTDLNADCGPVADGCGNIINCWPAGTTACPGTEYCGAVTPNKCGGNYLTTPDGGAACTPKTCADLGNPCGAAGDGCGGQTAVCSTCTSPQYCGGGGPSACGGNSGRGPDGGSNTTCVPKTCADLGNPCGAAGDGCGGMTPVCSTCTSPQFCGGGGANKCGGNNGLNPDGGIQCTPKTCANFPGTCGQQSDGCGGLTANCGTCTSPQFCGGGGASKCGGSVFTGADGGAVSLCTPKTCASLGYSCGAAGDGCGGKIDSCGPACPAPSSCGGGGNAGQCGTTQACTGLCAEQVKCTTGTTTLSGTVRSGLQESTNGKKWVPNGTTPDPVPGVLVYIPTTAVLPFDSDPTKPQVQCNQCGADVSGTPLVQTTTDYKGTFQLSNVPVGSNIPVVIQLGRWRRQFTVNITNSCGDNPKAPAAPLVFNLPSNSSEGDIPLTAISTGSYDSIECVLLKMGVAQDEFMSYTTWNGETVAAGSTAPRKGRVHIYTGTTAAESFSRGPGATIASGGAETALLGSGNAAAASPTNGNYMKYDQILLPCWGDEFTSSKSGAELKNLGYYGDHGGHFFATHYSYSWLNTNANSNLSSVANWDVGANPNTNDVGFTGNVQNTVPTSNPGLFLKWLNYVSALNGSNPAGAPPANPTVAIAQGRHDVDSVVAGKSVEWIDGKDPANQSEMLLHFTFDMPVSTANQCGHAIFSDFHVNGTTSNGQTFPAECDTTALTPQEKILEYMIWDLASCVPGTPTTVCTPTKTCANQGIQCGFTDDGCGNLLTCPACAAGTTCGGGGVANVCGAPDGGACTPTTCAKLGFTCGQTGDGCGGTLNCGSCAAGQACGINGTPGVCSAPPGNGCTPAPCTTGCGYADDGCGNVVACPACPAGQTCGGGGVQNQCGTPPTMVCTPQSCQAQQISCGPAANGCGGVIDSCGTCTPPQTCGGGGVPGQCGGTVQCTPKSCQDQGIQCGPAGDGCGNLLPNGCGTCTNNQTCGGGGVNGVCGGGGTCTPKTCQELNTTCGPAGDGCGGLIPSCGSCTPPDTCGGGGTPGQCGSTITK